MTTSIPRPHWSALASAALAALLFLLPGPAGAHDPARDFERAVEHAHAGERSLARSLLETVLISPRVGHSTRAQAYYSRGLLFYLDGLPVSAGQDFRRALEFDPKLATAQSALAWLHLQGQGVARHAGRALALYESAARNGHREAQFNLALLLAQGRVTEPVPRDALYWFEAAARQGHVEAMAQAGQLLARGDAGDKLIADPERARTYLEQAAERGHLRAKLELGLLLGSGPTEVRDPEAAVSWLEAAAARGSASAQSRLGYLYLNGLGVPRDSELALMWFREAATQGDTAAQAHLGYLFDQGIGTDADPARAYTWYRRAAQRDHPTAQLNLALMYRFGRGVPQDTRQTRYWLERAAASGSQSALPTLAWLLATSSDPAVRDPERAIELAREAVAEQPSAIWLDTLAAALATSGRFKDAVQIQQQALASLAAEAQDREVSGGRRQAYLGRLAAYREGRPWRSEEDE